MRLLIFLILVWGLACGADEPPSTSAGGSSGIGGGGNGGSAGSAGVGGGDFGDDNCFTPAEAAAMPRCPSGAPEPNDACTDVLPCRTIGFDCCIQFRYCRSSGETAEVPLCDVQLGSGGACGSGNTAGECDA